MPKRFLPLIGVAALLWSGAESPAQEKAAKPDEEARKVCEQFGRAIFVKDIEAAAKLVADPWYDVADGKGRVTRGAEEVKKRLQSIFSVTLAAKDGAYKVDAFESFNIYTYEQVAEKRDAEERKILDEVLKKTDREVHVRFIIIVTVEVVTKDGMKRSVGRKEGRPFVMLVGWRDGQAKVVGIRFG